MSSPSEFSDLGKNANELLNKGFPSTDKFDWKFEIDTTSSNNVKFVPSVTHFPGRGVSTQLKTVFKDYNLTVIGNHKDELSVEYESPKTLSGIKPTLKLNTSTRNLKEKLVVGPGGEIKAEWLNLKGGVEYPLRGEGGEEEGSKEAAATPAATLSATVGSPSCRFVAGFDFRLVHFRSLDFFNLAANYRASDLEVTLFSKSKPGLPTMIGANYYQTLANKWKNGAISGEVTYPLNSKGAPLTVALGALFKPDDSSTLKGRITSKGLLGLSYTQNWGGPFTVTFSAETSTLVEDTIHYGFKISIK